MLFRGNASKSVLQICLAPFDCWRPLAKFTWRRKRHECKLPSCLCLWKFSTCDIESRDAQLTKFGRKTVSWRLLSATDVVYEQTMYPAAELSVNHIVTVGQGRDNKTDGSSLPSTWHEEVRKPGGECGRKSQINTMLRSGFATIKDAEMPDVPHFVLILRLSDAAAHVRQLRRL
eukprot:6175067-Pleurochrysis_carterae.AAC.1